MDESRAHELLEEERRRLESLEVDTRAAGDGPAATEARSQAIGLLEQYETELNEVDEALGRLDDGTYGICEVCGEPISDERLEAVPTARFHPEHDPTAHDAAV